jgi:two-component system, sensor histidine kinase RegB
MTAANDKLTSPGTSTRDFAPHLALPWVVRLRYGIVCGEAAIVLGMTAAFHLDIPLLWTLATLAVVLASNLWLASQPAFSVRFPQQTLGGVFVLDTLCLTVMLGLTGGPANPFSLLYLVQITISAVVLTKIWKWALAGLSTVCFGLLFPFHLSVPAFEGHHVSEGLSPHLVGMWVAFIIAAGLITFFAGKVSEELREREQEVLKLQEQISKNERLASLATLAAGAAHELGTPLATIAVVSRELERYASRLADGNDVLEDAQLIRSEVERCRRILERMSLEGAEPMGEAPRTILLSELLKETLDEFSETQRASFIADVPETDVAVVLPVEATTQSLAALIKNALDATVAGGKIIIRAAREGSEIAISVADSGQGMPETVLRRVAEPFFTTKEPGKGMGLGTFLARTFAERLGGGLSFESTPGKGTTAKLHLPVNAPRSGVYASV